MVFLGMHQLHRLYTNCHFYDIAIPRLSNITEQAKLCYWRLGPTPGSTQLSVEYSMSTTEPMYSASIITNLDEIIEARIINDTR